VTSFVPPRRLPGEGVLRGSTWREPKKFKEEVHLSTVTFFETFTAALHVTRKDPRTSGIARLARRAAGGITAWSQSGDQSTKRVTKKGMNPLPDVTFFDHTTSPRRTDRRLPRRRLNQ
jgi:hypothetical protein